MCKEACCSNASDWKFIVKDKDVAELYRGWLLQRVGLFIWTFLQHLRDFSQSVRS